MEEVKFNEEASNNYDCDSAREDEAQDEQGSHNNKDERYVKNTYLYNCMRQCKVSRSDITIYFGLLEN